MAFENDKQHPILFRNFGDVKHHEQLVDVAAIYSAMQTLADGIGVLGYPEGELEKVTTSLSSPLDRKRFEYPWANDPELRLQYGTMPSITTLDEIIQAGWISDRPENSGNEWHTGVQYALLRLAHRTSKHRRAITIYGYGYHPASIDPQSLVRIKVPNPRRIIDYVVAIRADRGIKKAFATLRPLNGQKGGLDSQSWNQVNKGPPSCDRPIALVCGARRPSKSCADGKVEIAIWTDMWLKRLALLLGAENKTDPWPAIPLLVAQGHDWHLLVISREQNKTVIWNQIDMGSTRSCFDALKVIAALHWCMNWAETVWRPWFLTLI
jgi:hypothetical protein